MLTNVRTTLKAIAPVKYKDFLKAQGRGTIDAALESSLTI